MQRRALGPLVSIEADKTDVKQLVLGLAEKYKFNYVLGPQVKGQIPTLRLSEVRLAHVLRQLAALTGNVYRYLDGVHQFISPQFEEGKTISVVFAPRHRNVVDMTVSKEVRANSPFTDPLGGGSDASEDDTSNDGTFSTSAKLVTQLKLPGLDRIVKQLASEVKLATDATSNLIYLSGPANEVNQLLSLMQRIDREPVFQVQIEVKIVEVVREHMSKLGIRWGTGTTPGIVVRDTGGNGTNTTLSLGMLPFASTDPGLEGRLQASDAGGLSGRRQFRHLEITNLDLFLDAFEKRHVLRLISSPRVTTLSGQPAYIDITRKISYVKSITQTISGDNSVVTLSSVPDVLHVGPQMLVTPFVDRAGLVTLNLNIKLTQLFHLRTFLLGGTGTGSRVQLPDMAERHVQMTVQVKDGTTLVIGGLMANSQSYQRNGIPGIMNLPFISPFVSRKDVSVLKEEAMIFLTVRVVRAGRSFGTRQDERRVWYGNHRR